MNLDSYLTQIIMAVFLAVAAFLGAQAKALYRKYVTTEIKQAVVRTTVRYVEQIYKDVHGDDKLHAAMAKASSILAGYGITISEAELCTLIEAAVNEFNKSFERSSEYKAVSAMAEELMAEDDAAEKGQHLPGATVQAPAAEEPEPAPIPSAEEIVADLTQQA